MKNYLVLILLLLFNVYFSQNININNYKQTNIGNIDPLIKHLSSELIKLYQENNKAKKHDNLFRLYISCGRYDDALKQIDSVRNIYISDYPEIANVMGVQFEVYLTAKTNKELKGPFEQRYLNTLSSKYGSLSNKSRILLPRYFHTDIKKLEKEIFVQITENIQGKDDIDKNQALLLCRQYATYIVATETFYLANKYLEDIDKDSFEVIDSIFINDKINGRLVINKKCKNPESTILVNTIYPESHDLDEQKTHASYGYHSMYIYPRGKRMGNSIVEPFEHEATDINKAIDWVIKQKWSNGRVGMIGGSYLGFSQWAATKKVHPALKTIIPQASVGIGTMDFPMNNNIFASYTLRWLNYVTNGKFLDQTFDDEDRWKSIYLKWYTSGLPFNKLDSISGKQNQIFQRWLKHPTLDKYWQSMVPYKKDFTKIDIPILTITGYYDSDQLGALYYLKNHYKYNSNANHYLIIGPYDHSGAQGYIKKNLKGFLIDDVAMIDVQDISFQWFDYILKGKAKPAILNDKINYQVMASGEWRHVDNMNIFEKSQLKLYIQNGSLAFNNKSPGYSSLQIDLRDRSDASDLINEEDNIVSPEINLKNNLIFQSDPFSEGFEFTGNFKGHLKISVNQKDVDLYAKLYEYTVDGEYFLLSTYYGRASFSKSPVKRRLLEENKKTNVVISNNEFVSKQIKAGSKIILILGILKSPYMQINYGTGKDVSIESIADARKCTKLKVYNESYIEIPLTRK